MICLSSKRKFIIRREFFTQLILIFAGIIFACLILFTGLSLSGFDFRLILTYIYPDAVVYRAGDAARVVGVGDWVGWRVCVDAFDVESVVWSFDNRCRDVCGCGSGAGAGWDIRLLFAGASRHVRRSADSAAI